MTEGTAFRLGPAHLGRHRHTDQISLHARVSATLERICRGGSGGLVDVLDGLGERVRIGKPAGEFVQPVELFDVPREAPHQLVVYGQDAAARVGNAFPDMPHRPYAGQDGIAFELDGAHLGKDQFGLVHLNEAVWQAIDSVLGDSGASGWKVFDGEGLPVAPTRTRASGQIDAFEGLNGFEPRYVVFRDQRAAERFARRFPAMRSFRLAVLERAWRAARMS